MNALVNDALAVLDTCADVAEPESAAALGLLALIAGQDVELGDEGLAHRARGREGPRHLGRRPRGPPHAQESLRIPRRLQGPSCVEPETGLITAAALTPASAPDGPNGVKLLEGEAPGLQVLADGAYGSGPTLAALEGARHQRAIKPYPTHVGIEGGFHRDDFVIDHAARTATCPAGHVVTLTAKNNAIFGDRCARCPLRDRCTTSKKGRILHLTAHDAQRVESRRAWRDGDFISDYRKYRPMVERSIAWLVRDHYRRVRFRGVEKNQLASRRASPRSTCDVW